MKKNLRIYSTENLKKGKLTLNKKQSHYLKNVMRLESVSYTHLTLPTSYAV